MRYLHEVPDAKLYGDAPVINANVRDSSGKPFVPKKYIIKKTASGLKVGIISILGDQVVFPAILKPPSGTIAPPAEMLGKEIEALRKKADIIVVLSHAGRASKTLGESVPGIDVILSGHSLGTQMEAAEKAGDAILMATRANSKYVGKLVLDIGSDKKITGFSSEYVPLDKNYQDDPEIAKLVADQDREMAAYYTAMRNQMARPGSLTQPRNPQPFVGVARCAECHAKERESWGKTGHAKAFQALSKDNRQSDPECLSCHTTGFKVKGGFTSEAATPHLKDIQCEVCHGPGVGHSRKPKAGYGIVSQTTCLHCHDAANSPKYEHKSYMTKVIHAEEQAK